METQLIPRAADRLLIYSAEDIKWRKSFFASMEIMFTVVFVLELMWNMLVHWFWEFFSDGWNLFDGVVVTVSLVSLAVDGTNFKAMRLLRVLRALRLVARLESLRKIVDALTRAIFPVLSAMFVAILVIAIYSILGVNFFGSQHQQTFGDFGRAAFTLVACATMENWVTYAVETMGGEQGTLDPGVVAFFVSYIILVAYVLTSVIVAVLLENFSEASHAEERNRQDAWEQHTLTADNPLDPILSELSLIESSIELDHHLEVLFRALDRYQPNFDPIVAFVHDPGSRANYACLCLLFCEFIPVW